MQSTTILPTKFRGHSTTCFPVLSNGTPSKYLDGFFAAVGAKNGCPALVPALESARRVSPAEAVPLTARESLSLEEQIKTRLHPLDALPRLLDCAQANEPPNDEDRFRFRWFGLFYEGSRQDAFSLRLRLPGGRLKQYQLSGLARITQESASGYVLLNARGGLDVPGIPVRAAAVILRQLEEIGLSARQTGGDCVRSVRGGAYDGIGEATLAPPIYPLVCALEQALAYSRTLSNLPRGCEIIFRAFGEPPSETKTRLERTVIIHAMPGRPPITKGINDPAEKGTFLLLVPGIEGEGIPFTANRIIPACLQLLMAWAANGDRTDRRRATLAAFCTGMGKARLGTLLGRMDWHPAPDHSTASLTGKTVIKPAAATIIPGGRLLSGQLARMAEVMTEQKVDDLRLADGRVFLAQAADGVTASGALYQAVNS